MGTFVYDAAYEKIVETYTTDELFQFVGALIDEGTMIDLAYPDHDGQCFVMVEHEASGGLCYFGATPHDALIDAAKGLIVRQRRYGRLPHQRTAEYTFRGVRVTDG